MTGCYSTRVSLFGALNHESNVGIAGSELIIIPEAGHLANLEQPVLFNRALARFLSHRL